MDLGSCKDKSGLLSLHTRIPNKGKERAGRPLGEGESFKCEHSVYLVTLAARLRAGEDQVEGRPVEERISAFLSRVLSPELLSLPE